MRRFPFSACVIGLALHATALTGLAAAAETSPPEGPTPAIPGTDVLGPPTATPLGLRPTKPLSLVEESPHTGFGWKLASVLLVGAIGAWAWKHRQPEAAAADLPALRILRRTSIGVRSELLVVEMDGQRLLLGVTPNAIQNLYIAPFVDGQEGLDLAAEEAAASGDPEGQDRPSSYRSFVQEPVSRRLQEVAASARATKPFHPRATRTVPMDAVEEQARGIRAIAERK